MAKCRFFYLIAFFLVVISISCSDQSESINKDERGFDRAYLERLNQQDRYDYDRTFEVASNESNALLNFIAKVFSGLAWFFNSVLGYLILAALVGLLIWILIRNSSKALEKKQLKEKERLLEVQPIEVEEKDYNQMIETALRKKDFRMAIRFGFLSCLNYLHKNELISWSIEKTNMDYWLELPENCQPVFDRMSILYEKIWYGDFEADKEVYNQLSRTFHELKQQSGS